jgi:hypothetical protein
MMIESTIQRFDSSILCLAKTVARSRLPLSHRLKIENVIDVTSRQCCNRYGTRIVINNKLKIGFLTAGISTPESASVSQNSVTEISQSFTRVFINKVLGKRTARQTRELQVDVGNLGNAEKNEERKNGFMLRSFFQSLTKRLVVSFTQGFSYTFSMSDK